MVNAAGLVIKLTRPQVQEQAADSSGMPPDYEGRIELDPILLDVERLVAALETGVFELSNTQVHQNLLLHHFGRSMSNSAILLHELCNMAGRAYRLANLLEISWRDLQWVISSVIVPTLAPAPEDVMEEGSESSSSMNN